jgi:competence protein ComEC
MNQAVIGIAIGLLLLHWWHAIPDYLWFVTAIMLGAVVSYFSRIHLLIWVALGAGMAALSASFYTNSVNEIPIERGNITIVAKVSSLLNSEIPTSTIDFKLLMLNSYPIDSYYPLNVRLNWLQPPEMYQGQIWQLTVKLRRPYGRLNSAGFDAEKYFVAHGIHGRGTVLSGAILASDDLEQRARIPHNNSSAITLRQRIFTQSMAELVDKTHMAYLVALGFGVRDALEPHDWQRLRDSGLAHLMAISGLHIGLAMLLGWWLGSKICALVPEFRRYMWLPLWSGFTCALGYAWLAGFSLPTIRAVLMCTIVMLLIRLRIRWSGWEVFVVALAICLMLNPLASYAAGFWMSFTAVFILYIANLSGIRQQHIIPNENRIHYQKYLLWEKVKVLAQLQCVLLLFMLPLQWYWFGGISLFAPFINFVSVPWVSTLTVPLVLAAISTVWFPWLSDIFWQLADWTLYPVIWLAEQSVGTWLSLSSAWLPCLIGGIGWAALWWFIPWRNFKWVHIAIFIVFISWEGPLFFKQAMSKFTAFYKQRSIDDAGLNHYKPPINEVAPTLWSINMLDVGHGLAVLIERNGKAVLYDTGNRWQQGSIAAAVIEPVLKKKGINQLDGLIVSHADNDHAGGIEIISQQFEPIWKRSSDRRDGFLPCVQGAHWQWEGLNFEVLWPPKVVKRATNPHSCVVQISDQVINPAKPTKVLLTGDIDAISELLLARNNPGLAPDILFVPHHGSKTSSTNTWLAGMSPELALVSSAKYNPWNLPSTQIKQRYIDKGTTWLNTAETGQVSITVEAGSRRIQRYRQDIDDTWYRRLFQMNEAL